MFLGLDVHSAIRTGTSKASDEVRSNDIQLPLSSPPITGTEIRPSATIDSSIVNRNAAKKKVQPSAQHVDEPSADSGYEPGLKSRRIACV